MQSHQYFTYKFSELPADVQETAIDNLRDINVSDSFWYESTFDDAKEIGKILGIEIQDIFFSGFWSQGDGAKFIGSYEYAKGAAKRIREYAPKDTELHEIADNLQALQRRYFYRLSARVTDSGRYCHAYATEIRVYRETEYSLVGDVDIDTSDALCEYLRDFMRWIYRRLESQYDWCTSDESVRETIEANEYEFTDDGQLH